MDDKVLKAFLQKIAQIESAGGKYTKHKTMRSGMHKGSSAIGTYGLMPNTIAEIIQRSKQEPNADPNILALEALKEDQLRQKLEQNPNLQDSLARNLAGRVLDRFAGDELRSAYAWNMGHNLPSKRITKEKLAGSPYVQKYQKLSAKKQEDPTSYDFSKLDEVAPEQELKYNFKDLEAYLRR